MLKAMIVTPENVAQVSELLGHKQVSENQTTNNKTWIVFKDHPFAEPYAMLLPDAAFHRYYTVITPHEDFYEVGVIYN